MVVHRLVVVQHIDGQRMEKYYILVSLILSLCLTIPPYAAKKYGCVIFLYVQPTARRDPYFMWHQMGPPHSSLLVRHRRPTRALRLAGKRWFPGHTPYRQNLRGISKIGTQLAWTMMTVVGEVCATLIVAIYVIKHRVGALALFLS